MSEQKRALILGVTGQDGSYLADILLEKGYEVHGLRRRTSTGNERNIAHLKGKITMHEGDLLDVGSLYRAMQINHGFHEVYNEADQDNQGWSYSTPAYNSAVTFGAVCELFEMIRTMWPATKVFQPCSATMFQESPGRLNEESPHNPQSPYACAKTAVYHLCRMYREKYGLFIATGIFFNHDSVRRSEEYLVHKIGCSVARIKQGLQETLSVGNLDYRVDVGWAKEYMYAAHDLMQLKVADDFCIGTGVPIAIELIVDAAFRQAGMSIADYAHLLLTDLKFYKPLSGTLMVADIVKAHEVFGFAPIENAVTVVQQIVQAKLEYQK